MKKSFSALQVIVSAIATLIAAMLASCASCDRKGATDGAVTETITTHGCADDAGSPAAMAATISRQGRLYTTACQVHKVVLFTDEAQLKSPVFEINIPGERKVAVPIDVTLKGYVDFSEFSASNIELRDSLCLITLPDPRVEITASKINHEAVRQYVSMTRSNFSDAEINRLAAQGEDTIANHLTSYGIVERSRESCVRTLMPMLEKMGYHDANVVIRFRKDYTNQDLRSLTMLP